MTHLVQSYDQHLSTLLSPTKLDEIFQNLGAKPGLTRPTRIEPSFEAPQRTFILFWSNFAKYSSSKRTAVSVIKRGDPFTPRSRSQVSPLMMTHTQRVNEVSLRPDSRIHALRTLMIMSLDDSVLRNAELIRLTQEAIEAFFVAIPETEIASMVRLC